MLGTSTDANAKRVIVRKNIVNASRWVSFVTQNIASVPTARILKLNWKKEWQTMNFW